jgi:hypothetical protein
VPARHVSPDADLQRLFGPTWATLQAHHRDIPDCAFEPMPAEEPECGLGATAPPGHRWQNCSETAELTIVVGPGWLSEAWPTAPNWVRQ